MVNSNEALGGEPPKPVVELFRVSDRQLTEEFIVDGHRYLYWQPGPDDDQLSRLAGWDELSREDCTETDRRVIEMPAYTRSASSIMAGAKAWDTEKEEVVKAIARYQRQVRREFGHFDISVCPDTVAITKFDRSVILVPPHDVRGQFEDDDLWLRGFVEDIDKVLGSDQAEARRLKTVFLRELITKEKNE